MKTPRPPSSPRPRPRLWTSSRPSRRTRAARRPRRGSARRRRFPAPSRPPPRSRSSARSRGRRDGNHPRGVSPRTDISSSRGAREEGPLSSADRGRRRAGGGRPGTPRGTSAVPSAPARLGGGGGLGLGHLHRILRLRLGLRHGLLRLSLRLSRGGLFRLSSLSAKVGGDCALRARRARRVPYVSNRMRRPP